MEDSKTIVVDFTEISIRTEKSVTRPLFWHDPLKKQMQYFNGGQLTFEYGYDKWMDNLPKEELARLGYESPYRLLPKVIDLKSKINSKSSNKEQVVAWFKRWLHDNTTDVEMIAKSDKRFVFRVPIKEYKDFVYELDRKNFKHWEQ